MTIAEIKRLPLTEKLQLMEALWDELRNNADALLVPEWQKTLLDARRQAVEEGREQVYDWDTVKESLRFKHK